MKTKLLTLLLLFAGYLLAQDVKRPSVEELHNRKWNYIVERAKLTPLEAASVKPDFLEFEQDLWKIAETNKDFYKKFFKEKEKRTEADYENMNNKMLNAEIQRVHLMKSYYSKLKKHLTAETIFRYFNAERSFKKELIDNWQGRRKGRPEN